MTINDEDELRKKLIMNYTQLTKLARKESKENIPILTNKFYPELIPKHLILYSEQSMYHVVDSAVCFYLYDDEFNGQYGLWNSIYYNDQPALQKFNERFQGVKLFIEPDASQVDCAEAIENKHRLFENRIMSLWFIHQINAWVIPNITFAGRYSFEYMLLGIEECEVVAFSLKGSMEHSIDMEIYEDAIKYTVDHLVKLKAIVVFSTSKYDDKVKLIFRYASEKGIQIFIPENTQKDLNSRK